MAKKKRKNSEKKRNLKYGNISLAKEKSNTIKTKESKDWKTSKGSSSSKEDKDFRKELRRSLAFTGSFLLVILVLYFILTKTNALNPLLSTMELGNLYK